MQIMPTIKLTSSHKKQRVPTVSKKAAQVYYQDSRWKSLRQEKLRCNPICQDCEAEGKTTAAAEVHHVMPFMNGHTEAARRRLAFDIDNLKSLCIECHKLAHCSS